MFSTLELKIRLFGAFRLERTGTPIPLPRYQRARALLAFLAVEQGEHSREFLADLLWPMQDAASGRDNLRRMLFQLKDVLHASPLKTTRNTVELPPSQAWRLDVAELTGENEPIVPTEIMQRLACYQGHFMQGFALDGSPGFEQWMETRRTEYQSRFVALSLRLVDLLQRSEGSSAAINHARRLVSMTPWVETGWQCLLRLLAESGRLDEARSELTRCRRALWDELGSEPSAQTLSLLERHAPPRATGNAERAPERRLLTVLHCELGILGSDDPETRAQRFEQVCAACRQTLLAFGAQVSPSPGGLLGYFGFPVAREGDARRAAQAALSCIHLIAHANHNHAQARIGLHSGIVICQPGQASPDAAGLVSRVAAKVCEAAAPGEALMSASTRALIAHTCRDTPRGTLVDRFSDQELEIFTLLETNASRPRWAGDSTLIGRRTQLDALKEAAQDVLIKGQGRLVVICGEAGLGKTRLLRELAAYMSDLDIPPPAVFHCLPERADKAFHPFLDWLKTVQASPAAQHLEAALARLARPAEGAAVLASLLDNDTAHEAAFRHWQPGLWSQHAIAALGALLDRSFAEHTPIFVEDMHWSDPSTRELCVALTRAVPARLLVLTTRPGFDAAWLGAHAVRIDLMPLNDEESLTLAKAVLADHAPETAQLERMIGSSQGVPLFIEELAHQISFGSEHVPLALQDIFQARVDSAGEALPSLRLCACLGANIDRQQLAQVEGIDAQDAQRILESLSELGLLEALASGRFGFRHALLREAAYQSQTRATQTATHQKIIRALLQHNPDAARADPELFAWHYLRTDDIEAAIRCHAAAGGHAAARSLYREALNHYQMALELLDRRPEHAANPSISAALEMELRLSLGIPLLALHGNGSAQAIDNFRRTLALADAQTALMDKDPRMFQVYWGLWLGSSSLENFHLSCEFGEKLVVLAQQSGHANTRSHAHYALGNSLFCLGRFNEAIRQLEQGAALYDAASASLELGEDPLVTNLSFLSWAYWFCGRHDEALDASDHALNRARALSHPYTLGYALVFAAILHRLRREPEQAEVHAREALELAQQFGLALWQAAAQVILGWVQVMRGDAEGMNTLFSVLGIVDGVMGGVESMFLAHLIEACHVADQPEAGLQAIERGLAVAELRKDWHYLAEFQRMKGEFLLRQGASIDEAARWFAHAANTAAEQNAPSLQLRAAISQARGCILTHPRNALALLDTALARFPHAAATGDMLEARELAQCARSEGRQLTID